MTLRGEYLERESAAWRELQGALDEGRDAFGWSTSAVAGHVAYWVDRAADAIESIGAGTYEPTAFATDVDAENDRLLPAWDAMPVGEARAALDTARGRLVAAWTALEDPTDEAAEWFAGDGFEHYEEHVGG
jgi:hypothetical protein